MTLSIHTILTPADEMKNVDAKKLGRVNPRNFAAMTETTLMAMAVMTFGTSGI
jgi:hypothetical protein